jgi:hypothetical protein
MEEDILRVVEESRSSSKVLGSMNSTFIALIPKKNNPEDFEVACQSPYAKLYTK